MQGDLVFLPQRERDWLRMQGELRWAKPKRLVCRPRDHWRAVCYDVQRSDVFEAAVLLVIIANTVCLAADYWSAPDVLRYGFQLANLSFTVIFAAEMTVKLVALGWHYFSSAWNCFDAVVTVGSLTGVLAFLAFGATSGLIVTVVRVFRVLRVARMIEGLASARQLLDTVLLTLPGVFNIACLLVLVIFIFAVLGNQLFAKIQFYRSLEDHASFRTFPSSMLTLIRFSTGEAWSTFMYDAAMQQSGCSADPEYDPKMCGFDDHPGCVPLNGCGSLGMIPFLMAYTLVVTMIMFNLFIGVIIEGFQEANEGNRSVVTKRDVAAFVECWSKHDPQVCP